MEYGIGFDGELVPGDVRRIEADRSSEIRQGLLRGLAGQPIHKVDIDIGKTRPGGRRNRRPRLAGVVNPAYGREFMTIEALRADG